ncbi:hypothetical protein FISHEDRAFT_55972 [Fistulina hepatica ATCC 64428]|uniref:CBM1 domain-containing protein n=1 Tax=Fistulina hepatica ATCC 64428 TaxID=1128425 RepID=A0A0D7ALL8_9AGAR|nr:hypothetical protein FISHEDRAFT_55972 [Fistulina hepatica ATCC 64428]
MRFLALSVFVAGALAAAFFPPIDVDRRDTCAVCPETDTAGDPLYGESGGTDNEPTFCGYTVGDSYIYCFYAVWFFSPLNSSNGELSSADSSLCPSTANVTTTC